MGIDYVLAAIEAAAAKSRGVDGLSYIVGDVTQLLPARLDAMAARMFQPWAERANHQAP